MTEKPDQLRFIKFIQSKRGAAGGTGADAADDSRAHEGEVNSEGSGQDHLTKALDDALRATLADLDTPAHLDDGAERPSLETSLLFHYGTLVADPEALVHANAELEATKKRGAIEEGASIQGLIGEIEALQAKSADELDSLIEATLTFRATLEALNEYISTDSLEAAYAVLERQRGLLVTDLAVELIQGKVAELQTAGDTSRAQQLERGPLRLVKDVRDHGLEKGYRNFLDRDRRQEAAKARIAFLIGTSGSDLVDAVDAVLGADGPPALELALDRGYPWLVQIEAATIIREAVVIREAGSGSEEETARFDYLASILERLSAISREEPGLSRQEQISRALSQEVHE
jgi:hypothetical protein